MRFLEEILKKTEKKILNENKNLFKESSSIVENSIKKISGQENFFKSSEVKVSQEISQDLFKEKEINKSSTIGEKIFKTTKTIEDKVINSPDVPILKEASSLLNNSQKTTQTVSDVLVNVATLNNQTASAVNKISTITDPILKTINLATNTTNLIYQKGEGVNLKTTEELIKNTAIKTVSSLFNDKNLKPIVPSQEKQVFQESSLKPVDNLILSNNNLLSEKFKENNFNENSLKPIDELLRQKSLQSIQSLLRAFALEPKRTNLFVIEFSSPPRGWLEKKRAVYINVVKPYFKNLGWTEEEIDSFLKGRVNEGGGTIFSEFLKYKVRKVNLPHSSFQDVSLRNFNLNFGFPGLSRGSSDGINVDYIKETPLVEYSDNPSFPVKLSYFTMDDFIELWRRTQVDETGVAYYPYDYLIPYVFIHELIPGKNSPFVKSYTWVLENCYFVSKTRKDYSYNSSREDYYENFSFKYLRYYRKFSNFLTENITF